MFNARAAAFLAAILVAGSTVYLAAGDSPAPQTISGEVISVCNYMVKGSRGEEGREAGIFLVEKRGLPVAILEDGTDQIFIAIMKNSESANKKLAPLMGKKVNAHGVVHRKNGSNLIEIAVVAEAL